MSATWSFSDGFRSLTDYAPMRWQRRLFKRFIQNKIPETCDIPTGLGKTSVMIIWLLALAQQAKNRCVQLPRRLIYIVNRRTVVDQATSMAEGIRRRLLAPEQFDWNKYASTLRDIAFTLRRMRAFEETEPLAISTLRGELADNEEWKSDPARPAIVVGTVDMIGSKLLFSGYGDGPYWRPHHAGLIGQDALIVHDEAHLTPAFSDLLRAVAEEQRREATRSGQMSAVARPIRVVELSATRRSTNGNVFTLEPEDRHDPIVRQRITATKRLYLHQVPADDVVNRIVELARQHEQPPSKVLIYVRAPEQVQRVASALRRSETDDSIALLTGTVRGYERDALVKSNPVYRALLHPELHVEKTVYLVSTSAGEVGIDLDADHLVCDLTTLDGFIQRLGRVNRRGGEGRTARVDVVASVEDQEKQSELGRAITATCALLKGWVEEAGNAGVDVSSQNLRRLLANASPGKLQEAFSPKPATALLTDILLDNWSLTSIDTLPGRGEVAPFLHGLTFDPPETYVAWRYEVSRLHDAGADEDSLRRWFRACRIEARERLRDRTDRVTRVLKDLLRNLRRSTGDDSIDFPIVLLDERGGAAWSCLSAVAESDLAYRTVVLPVNVGGLDENGLLDAKSGPRSGLDVAEDDATNRGRERWICRSSLDEEQFERLVSGEVVTALRTELREKERIPLRQRDEGDDEAESIDLVLLMTPTESALENPETSSTRQTLQGHTDAIVEHMSRVVERLSLGEPLGSALRAAARWHDKGKDRAVWQRYARNGGGAEILAKATRYGHPRELGGYRHEFGSLLDAMNDTDLQRHPERELVLHLISAHHGWARPHFDLRSFDSSYTTNTNNVAFSEVVRRFGRLQHRYGRWGLAWLESLVRCADIAASQGAIASPGTTGGSHGDIEEEVRP